MNGHHFCIWPIEAPILSFGNEAFCYQAAFFLCFCWKKNVEKNGVNFQLCLFLLGALCNTPLGLQSGRLPNSKITASSERSIYYAARLGRLGRKKQGRYMGGWGARLKNSYQWLKVDFGRVLKITKILTQGRQDYSEWVRYFKVSSSLDGYHWQYYRYKNSDKVSSKASRGSNGRRQWWFIIIIILGVLLNSFLVLY